MRKGIRAVLSALLGIEIVWAADGREALAFIEQHRLISPSSTSRCRG
jgi:hypothetical protein